MKLYVFLRGSPCKDVCVTEVTGTPNPGGARSNAVLVTGRGAFGGGHLVDRLRAGCEVRAVDIKPTEARHLEPDVTTFSIPWRVLS